MLKNKQVVILLMSLNIAVCLQQKIARRTLFCNGRKHGILPLFYFYLKWTKGLDHFGSHTKDLLCVVVTTWKNSGCKISLKLGLIRINTHWGVGNALLSLLVTFTDFRAVFPMKINTSWIPVSWNTFIFIDPI